ncbi:MAG TPA: hypothetical protein VFB21_16815 [Chthonomonadaceae bacterium]|nr:hypothetical protein [Chthonomonadaceae bacterium]
MGQRSEYDLYEDDYLLAGMKAMPGTYRRLGSRQILTLEKEDILPASLDGNVACYVRVDHTWAEHYANRRAPATLRSPAHREMERK